MASGLRRVKGVDMDFTAWDDDDDDDGLGDLSFAAVPEESHSGGGVAVSMGTSPQSYSPASRGSAVSPGLAPNPFEEENDFFPSRSGDEGRGAAKGPARAENFFSSDAQVEGAPQYTVEGGTGGSASSCLYSSVGVLAVVLVIGAVYVMSGAGPVTAGPFSMGSVEQPGRMQVEGMGETGSLDWDAGESGANSEVEAVSPAGDRDRHSRFRNRFGSRRPGRPAGDSAAYSPSPPDEGEDDGFGQSGYDEQVDTSLASAPGRDSWGSSNKWDEGEDTLTGSGGSVGGGDGEGGGADDWDINGWDNGGEEESEPWAPGGGGNDPWADGEADDEKGGEEDESEKSAAWAESGAWGQSDDAGDGEEETWLESEQEEAPWGSGHGSSSEKAASPGGGGWDKDDNDNAWDQTAGRTGQASSASADRTSTLRHRAEALRNRVSHEKVEIDSLGLHEDVAQPADDRAPSSGDANDAEPAPAAAEWSSGSRHGENRDATADESSEVDLKAQWAALEAEDEKISQQAAMVADAVGSRPDIAAALDGTPDTHDAGTVAEVSRVESIDRESFTVAAMDRGDVQDTASAADSGFRAAAPETSLGSPPPSADLASKLKEIEAEKAKLAADVVAAERIEDEIKATLAEDDAERGESGTVSPVAHGLSWNSELENLRMDEKEIEAEVNVAEELERELEAESRGAEEGDANRSAGSSGESLDFTNPSYENTAPGEDGMDSALSSGSGQAPTSPDAGTIGEQREVSGGHLGEEQRPGYSDSLLHTLEQKATVGGLDSILEN